MAKKNWEQLVDAANRELKDYGVQLRTECEGGEYDLYVDWDKGESDTYAQGYYENELEPLILEAKQHSYEESDKRGDQIIICVIHAELSGRHGKVTHWKKLFGNERAAMRWLNNMVPTFLDKPMWIKKDTDTEEVNEALAEQYDDPNNERFYVRMEDVTEQTVAECIDVFAMHYWKFNELTAVASMIGIDFEKFI